jgi:hypothetical protein
MVDRLERLGIGILFTIGGDGTLRGAHAIAAAAAARGLTISVIGVPKTIDNDISFVQRTFGFETAVSEARRATAAANSEAEAARNGIGLVKLMGRDSGFIAAYSVLANSQVELLPGARSAVHARAVPVRAVPAPRTPRPCRDRRRRRRGSGSHGRETRIGTRRATSSTAISACSCAMPSPGGSGNPGRRSV